MSPAIPTNPIKFLIYISRNNKWLGISAFLTMIAGESFHIYSYLAIAKLVDALSSATNLTEQLAALKFWGLIFLAARIGGLLMWRLNGRLGIAWLINSRREGHEDLYGYLMKHSHNYFINRFAGSVAGKAFNGSDKAADLGEQLLWRVGGEVVTLAITIFLFWKINWTLGAMMAGMFVLVFIFNAFGVKKRYPLVRLYADAYTKTRGECIDSITNISTVRQYARTKQELSHLSDVFADTARKDKIQSFFGEKILLGNVAIVMILNISVLSLSYWLLTKGLTTVGSLVLIFSLINRVTLTFMHVGSLINGLTKNYTESLDGLREILVPHEIVDKDDAKILETKEGAIIWKDVTFEYGANTVFHNFDLSIGAGQKVGLVGHSGAGKTTFVSLLLRQYDLDKGQILIDEQNIADVTQDSLRENIALVPQEPLLFHRSIFANIAYGREGVTREEVVEVAKKAEAHDFIMSLEKGYDTLVGERGVKLSGGQKQRVAIARAMLKDTPILILDEATSALDSESEVSIQKSLKTLMKNKTVIAVAHRLSTLREMDRIIVLSQGKVMEDGSHDELVKKKNGIYKSFWDHQAGGFLTE